MQDKLWYIMPVVFTIFSFLLAITKHDRYLPFDIPNLNREIYNLSRYALAFGLSAWVWYIYFTIFGG